MRAVVGRRNMATTKVLPLNDFREELGDKALIVRPQLLRVDRLIALAVEIVGVERPNSC